MLHGCMGIFRRMDGGIQVLAGLALLNQNIGSLLITPEACTIKLFECNKLECLLLANLSSLVLCLKVRLEPSQMKHLSVAPLLGRLLASPTNTRLGWKGIIVQAPGRQSWAECFFFF
jgi:hypothetical protein